MYVKIAVFLALTGILLASGCTGPDCGDCPDACVGDVLLHDGTCSGGNCTYAAVECEFGCSEDACLQRPAGLRLSDNPQQKGNFTIEILDSVLLEGPDGERDDYLFSMKATNTADSPAVLNVIGASLLASSGIMHQSTSFSWSDMLKAGEERTLSFAVRQVPRERRNQELTLLVRTNQGFYSFPAVFSAAGQT